MTQKQGRAKVEKKRPKVETTPDFNDEVQLAAQQISDLDDQICELNRATAELERKFTQGTITRSDLDDVKKQVDEVTRNALPLETCLREVAEKSRKQGSSIVTALLTPFLVFEGKAYSARIGELLIKAREVICWSGAVNRLVTWWLTTDQQRIQLHEYDLLAGIHLLCKSHKGANATTLEGLIQGFNKGRIGSEARTLVRKGYVREQRLRASLRGRGRRPICWELAQPGRDLVLGSGSTFSLDAKTHKAMKRKILNKGIRQRPPVALMWIEQIRGDRDRCDAIAVEREENDWGIYRAICIVTDADVSKQPNLVFRRMITPFAYGARRLEIFYQPASDRKLKKLWGKLPTWLQNRIDFTVLK
jgi:hypothetical protein